LTGHQINGESALISDAAAAYNRLFETIKILRAPGGCPWDRAQTPLSMRRDLIEETFEAVDAITAEDAPHAKEELGDVLLNASMISYMYEQNGGFKVADAVNELTDKLIRRHPHVFPQSEGAVCAEGSVNDSTDVIQQWDRIKEHVEKRGEGRSILDEVPASFPPLLRAYKLQKKAEKKGFSWKSLAPVKAKVEEEFREVNEAASDVENAVKAIPQDSSPENAQPLTVHSSPEADKAQLHLEEEFGDLFFAVVNYARHLGVDPVVAMNRENEKFYRRFTYIERKMHEAGIPMDDNHSAEEDAFWKQAKEEGL
jgi:tetrapyrrole methylase family protein / MazG family protein